MGVRGRGCRNPNMRGVLLRPERARGHVIGLMKQWAHQLGNRALTLAVLFGIWVVLLSGCAATRQTSTPLRTAIEQLLLSQALQRTLPEVNLPLPENSAVFLEAVGLTRDYIPDQEYVRQAIALQLAKQGFRLAQREEEAMYRIKILLQTFGTEQGVVFVGLPQVQSVLLPFALPEISLYKDLHQTGHVRWALTVFERATGRLISSSPWHAASTYYNHYTVLILVTFRLTDLELSE